MRKGWLLISLLILVTFSVSAQLNKGTWLIGGTSSFPSYKYTMVDRWGKEALLTIRPDIGYFIIDKLTGGIKLSYAFGMADVGIRSTNSSFIAGPFLRYYLLSPEKLVNLFTQIDYGYGTARSDGKKNLNFNVYTLTAGPEVYFNSSVGLEFGIGYSIQNYATGSTKGIQMSIGFHFHLEKNE